MKVNATLPAAWKFLDQYPLDNFYDEMVELSGQVRPCYGHHIALATGASAIDAAPIQGTFKGHAHSRMKLELEYQYLPVPV